MAIRYALAAVKNVGGAAIDALAAARDRDGPFKSLGGFADRAHPHHVNKRLLENLVRAGAFDALHSNRPELLESLDNITRTARAAATDRHPTPGHPVFGPCARMAQTGRDGSIRGGVG